MLPKRIVVLDLRVSKHIPLAWPGYREPDIWGMTLREIEIPTQRATATLRAKTLSSQLWLRWSFNAALMPKLAALLLGVAVFGFYITFISQASVATPSFSFSLPHRAPLTPALVLEDVNSEEALELNHRIPFDSGPNPPAKPFELKGDDLAYVRALECLTSTIYYEAAHESDAGQRAVAQVLLNRVRHPAFPNSVCGTTYQGSTRLSGCQFSFTCDGALRRTPNRLLWERARTIAAAALQGSVFAPVGYATHYHANYVVPYWATSLAKNAQVGTHIFYRWHGWWGQPPAFRNSHGGEEPDPLHLRHAALRLPGRPPAQELPFGTDSRVELISIIHLLASGEQSVEKLSPYERDILGYFSGHTDHEAVTIYRGLNAAGPGDRLRAALTLAMNHSAPPKMEPQIGQSQELIASLGGAEASDRFVAALRAFVATTGFAEFYAGRAPYFATLREQSLEPASQLLATVQRETDGHIPRFRLLLTPLLKNVDGVGGCEHFPKNKLSYWLLVSPAAPRRETFKAHEKLAEQIFGIAERPSQADRDRRSCRQPSDALRSSNLRRLIT